jgi:hypothetical protein
VDSLFKFVSEQLGFELEGSEEFVREQMSFFLPFVRGTADTPETTIAEPKEGSLPHWYKQIIPPGQSPTMQDHILIFAYYLYRQKRQFIFVPDDMKASFTEMNRVIPKSILQIMGSLKRDHGLLYPGKKRGEYSLTPEGIKYIEGVLGIRKPDESTPRPESPEKVPEAPPVDKQSQEADSPQRNRFFSLFKENGEPAENEHDS